MTASLAQKQQTIWLYHGAREVPLTGFYIFDHFTAPAAITAHGEVTVSFIGKCASVTFTGKVADVEFAGKTADVTMT